MHYFGATQYRRGAEVGQFNVGIADTHAKKGPPSLALPLNFLKNGSQGFIKGEILLLIDYYNSVEALLIMVSARCCDLMLDFEGVAMLASRFAAD